MNTPMSWIKAFVPELDVTDQEYTDAMTLTGTKVEGFERLDKNLEKIVVGKVIKVERHPDADKLVICQVDIGTQTTQIVTGAPNVFEGAIVPVVLDGGKVATDHDGNKSENGTKIKKGKLRGIESNGMMCSIEELGSSKEFYPLAPEDGLYIFPEGTPIGADAVEVLGLRDSVFEYEITSNRVDCFGIIGIAREAAATFKKKFVLPQVNAKGNSENTADYISVDIEDKDLCKRYCARVVKNVKIAPSPEWMQRRLAACGIRPINNLVDITNYVMEEYGQPMHAYDLNTIAGKKIVVKRAKDGDEYTTLDSQVRKLDKNVLMIWDSEKPVGIAGIMGGENSMITDDVKEVLFEAATFDGTNIRLSSKRVGLRTDASGKFEKGLDPNNAADAINRACELIEELGAGEVVGGMVDVYDNPVAEKRIAFEPDKYNHLLGTKVSKEEMLEYFARIEIKYDEAKNELIIPTFRQDLLCSADIAEEVARFFGYENIPITLPSGEATAGKISFKMRVENVARDIAEFCGFSQGMTYSFESPKVFDKLLIPADSEFRETVTISNPLGEDFSIMRTISLNGMLTSLSTNYNRRNKDAKLYELGNIYLPKQLPLTELPEERMQFTLGMYGDGDFFTMKGVIEELFDKLGMRKHIDYVNENDKPFLHPGRQANIIYDGKVVGYLGEVHPIVLDNYDISDRAYVAVLDMPEIVPFATFDRKYTGIAKFPAVTRDLSMVMPKEVTVGQVEKVFAKRGGKLLESYNLFDIYEGAQIKAGYKSVAYSLAFRDKEKTLVDKDIADIMEKILSDLKEMDIELRA